MAGMGNYDYTMHYKVLDCLLVKLYTVNECLTENSIYGEGRHAQWGRHAQ